MGTKRASPDGDLGGPPLKQTKLHFSRSMAQATSATNTKTKPKDLKAAHVEAVEEEAQADATVEQGEKGSSKNAATNPVVFASNFTITEITGDIFDAPDNTVIIHACNCMGSWGAGIALAFKQRYPKAFQAYTQHCKSQDPTSLIRTALLILLWKPKDRATTLAVYLQAKGLERVETLRHKYLRTLDRLWRI
jgi:hypothetical protein